MFEPILMSNHIAFKSIEGELTSVNTESVLTKKYKHHTRLDRFFYFGAIMRAKKNVSKEKLDKIRDDSRNVYEMHYIVIDRDRDNARYRVSKKEFKRINRAISAFRKKEKK